MSIKKSSFMFILLVIIQFSHAQKIRVVTEGAYPPWNDVNKMTGEVQGYDVDVAKAICAEAKLNCEFSTQNWDSIISSLRFNKYDLIIASLTDNPDRRRVIDFSKRYAIASTQLVTLSNKGNEVNFCKNCPKELNIESSKNEKTLQKAFLDTFSNKRIGVQENTVAFKYFFEHKTLSKSIDVVSYNTMDEVLEAVLHGDVDAAIGDTSFLIDYANRHNDQAIIRIGPEIIGKTFGKGIAVGIRKADNKLKEQVNTAIDKIRLDGRLKDFSMKWFSYNLAPLDDEI